MDEAPFTVSVDAETAPKIGRKSARSPRVEIITGTDRRRSWTLEQKREIVAESLGPALTPTEVARKYGISTGLLYGWRQKILGRPMACLPRPAPRFVRVEMPPAAPQPDAPGAVSAGPAVAPVPATPPPPRGPDG